MLERKNRYFQILIFIFITKNELHTSNRLGKLPKNILGKTLSESKNLNEAAHNYYSYLIYLDQLCFKFNKKKIAVAKIPNIGLGKTINDRLKRGAKKSS